MKHIQFTIGLLLVVVSAHAVIATQEPVLKRLPDGTTREVYLQGDEHFHYLANEINGAPIKGTEIGIPIGDINAIDGVKKAPSAVKLTSYVPSRGIVRIPVVLVNFADVKFTLPNARDQFDDLYNNDGGSNPYATGSVHDYYAASSNGELNLVFDVYGPYNLKNSMAYYGGHSGNSSDKNARALVVEAAQLARQDGVDFSVYDNNDDGYIDNISIVVAGYNEAEGGPDESIWPHYSQVSSTERFSGKALSGYLIISEYRSSGGSVQAGIGTYCHEFGHALGLPDLYDTKNNKHYTVGTWDVMCSGSYNNNGSTPPTYTAFERFVMGWLTPEQLSVTNNYVLSPIETSNEAYLIASDTHNLKPLSPAPSEYFMIENRQAVGWDAGSGALVGTGLMISHITFSSAAWERNAFNNETILGYRIVSAANTNPQYSTPADLFPGMGNITMWIPTLNSGEQLLNQMVMNIIQLADGTMSFHYGTQTDNGFSFTPQVLEQLETTYDKGMPIMYDTANVVISVKNISSDTISIHSSSDYFDLSVDGGLSWITQGRTCKMKAYQDSVYEIPVKVRHAPKRQSCDVKTGYLMVATADGSFIHQLQMTAISPRPTYITQPAVLDAQNVSSTSFTMAWKEQEDAETYYLTLYSIQSSPSSDIQNFDDFSTIQKIEEEGWLANFAQQTSAVSAEGNAVLFTKTGQWLTSKEYIVSPTKISFWISNNYVASADEYAVGGQLLLEAKDTAGVWTTLDDIMVLRTTKNLQKEYNLSENAQFIQFRFSYAHIGGIGGVALDNFTAHLEKTVHYLYQGTEWSIPAPASQAIVSELEPRTTYYCSVQTYENKGCDEHFSPLSSPIKVTTLKAADDNATLEVMRLEDGTYVVTLPEPGSGTSALYIYDYAGHLFQKQDLQYGVLQTTIQTEGMLKGQHYILKVIDGKLLRKQAKGKMLYY